MLSWLQIGIAVGSGIVLFWLVLAGFLWIEHRRHSSPLRVLDLLRLVPDVVRLMKRLAADSSLPMGVRVWLGILLIYLISPIDLIPDFIPVLGYADDALVVAIALRFISRSAGTDAITRHWPGTSAGLTAVLHLAGVHHD